MPTMKTDKIWKCPKCKRIFRKIGQQHSCVSYPIEKHFERKEYAKKLYNHLKTAMRKKIKPFTVESLPCCIHFVNKEAYTFAAVFALKDRIRIHIASGKKPEDSRIEEYSKISFSRYLCSIEIKDRTEIDASLITLLEQSFFSQK